MSAAFVTEKPDTVLVQGPEIGAEHLRGDGVSITYSGRSRLDSDVLAVDTLDFIVCRGELVCIVGPSGCGKTTFLNAVAGFLPISDGDLTLEGAAITGPGPERAMVFQNPSLLPWRNALRNVTYGLEMSGLMRGRAAETRARDLLNLVGLGDFIDAYPNKLSGGMQQRVNLARALAVEPELLLLDEPFASVDAQTRETLQAELLRVCEQTSVTALFVTHDITEAVYLGDRVCVFSSRPGRLVSDTKIDLSKPRDPKSRRSSEFMAHVDQVADALVSGSPPEPGDDEPEE
ncbi:MAG: ABC transporter ATP-binding protein [Sciscionella sp.]